ncbi:MAG: hypothetical protein FHP94_03645 [Denitromonas halophila]|nr:MAG: hypothetical protein FHP94_03645 [Denitromonas halophila]TVT74844.1 MAG: hypothetical protein FHP93_01905 [Denitromonas halophila]
MKKVVLVMLMLHAAVAIGQDRTAEQLVSSKTRADMTYRELMEVMGKSLSTILEGIVRENKQMVDVGANFILTHPAPKHKPWDIMQETDQAAFKQSLLAFDALLDLHSKSVVSAAMNNDWIEAGNAAHALTSSCVSCHAMWKNKVK